jgi:serine/threonine-protein kinase
VASDRADDPFRTVAIAGGDDRVGSTIDGRYRLIALLGAGGMGRVYRGEHVHIRREVAVKLLHARLSENSVISERFEREAIAIGRLDHSNCVYVQDFGRTDDGLLYLVMELASGTPLDHVISRTNPVPWPRALHIGRHVLAGLGHAHAAGIVHRDIKPENIVLVERNGDDAFAKILDFGIAKLVGSTERDTGGRELTEAGMAFGTPTYMSPEQAYGQAVDGRADLYALSVLLVELITGRAPFKADDKLAVLAMHTSRPVPPLRELNPDVEVPAPVEELLRRGLAKDPALRYPDADAFAAAIDAVLGARPGEVAVAVPAAGAAAAPAPSTVALSRQGAPALLISAGPDADGGLAASAAGVTPAPGTSLCTPGAGIAATAPVLPHPPPATPTPVSSGAALAMPRRYDSAPVVYASPTGSTAELTMPRPRRSWLLTAAGVVAGLVILGVALSGSQSHRAETAAELREAGDPSAAVQFLEREPEAVKDDAQAQLQLGHSYLATGRRAEALDAYAAAIELRSALASDATLRDAVTRIAGDGDEALSARAAALALRGGPNADIETRLVDAASGARTLAVREAAREAARELGLAARVDLIRSYGLDLKQGKTCERRAEAVTALRALGDKRAIEPLEQARYRSGGSRFDRSNRNACLKQAAEEAIEHLRELAD